MTIVFNIEIKEIYLRSDRSAYSYYRLYNVDDMIFIARWYGISYSNILYFYDGKVFYKCDRQGLYS